MPLKIEPDVLLQARHFGIDPALIQAVVIAEGDILKAVRCSLPNTRTRMDALAITCRSAVHALSDFIKDGLFDTTGPSAPQQFVEYWAKRWAPRGAANDPTNLNKNWPVNVLKIWRTK